jgi:hypothetical protein
VGVTLPTGVAEADQRTHNRVVPSWGSYSYAYGPLVAFMVIGVMILVLRWAFGGRKQSVVERPARRGTPDQYGLLDPVASPDTYVEAEICRQHLEAAGIRATVAMTNDGPRVMVWPEDRATATDVLRRAP